MALPSAPPPCPPYRCSADRLDEFYAVLSPRIYPLDRKFFGCGGTPASVPVFLPPLSRALDFLEFARFKPLRQTSCPPSVFPRKNGPLGLPSLLEIPSALSNRPSFFDHHPFAGL